VGNWLGGGGGRGVGTHWRWILSHLQSNKARVLKHPRVGGKYTCMATPPSSTTICMPNPFALPPPLDVGMEWFVLQGGQWTPWPSFYCQHPQPQEPDTWGAKLQRMDALLHQCTPPSSWAQFLGGVQGDGCINATNCNGWLKDHRHEYALKVRGKFTKRSRSLRRGYIQVGPYAWDSNDFAFYLHTFICYAYHGPPNNDSLVAAHTCHHKLCLNPLHIRWITKSEDKHEDWDHRRRSRLV